MRRSHDRLTAMLPDQQLEIERERYEEMKQRREAEAVAAREEELERMA